MVGRRKRQIFGGNMSGNSIYLGFDFSTQQVREVFFSQNILKVKNICPGALVLGLVNKGYWQNWYEMVCQENCMAMPMVILVLFRHRTLKEYWSLQELQLISFVKKGCWKWLKTTTINRLGKKNPLHVYGVYTFIERYICLDWI